MDRFTLHLGDCREVMAAMDAESVDAIVSDPPYGLSFMGKGWDHGVPGEEFWREALRVAKPGAHLVAFGGTRTYHRLACAIEDAGWEIRDCLMWVYGSGFPKSHDVSKAMDKMGAADEQARRRLRCTAWVRSTGITARQIDEATGTNMGGHYTTAASQPAIMTREHLDACRHLLGSVPRWVEVECDTRSVESKTFAEREVISNRKVPAGHAFAGYVYGNDSSAVQYADTAPATDLARQWDGWGTALKPAWEPIILARKPLVGTVAANVARYGTGALNVDGCRVDGEMINARKGGFSDSPVYGSSRGGVFGGRPGRWPANVVHDGSQMVLDLFPPVKDESQSAARFFYCAKASKADRDAGLGDLPEATPGQRTERKEGSAGINPYAGGRGPARNIHPTVKPTDLMRWLVRLVTPPGGVVLDPFMGSGSTGKAAMLEGARFVGIDVTPEYVEIARRRIEHAAREGGDGA